LKERLSKGEKRPEVPEQHNVVAEVSPTVLVKDFEGSLGALRNTQGRVRREKERCSLVIERRALAPTLLIVNT
jgi:hypothetical protein